MRNDERSIQHFEFQMWPTSDRVVFDISVADIVPFLKQSIADGSNQLSILKDTQTIILRDVREFDECFALLIGVTDQKTQGKVFTNQTTLSQRIEKKKRNEVGEIGCHLLISKTQSDGSGQQYYSLLEQVTGLPRAYVVRLINSILRHYHKENKGLFTRPLSTPAKDKDGNTKQLSFRPICELAGYPSEDFTKAINSGNIFSIRLIRDQVEPVLGDRSYLTSKQQIVDFKPNKKQLDKIKGKTDIWKDLKIGFSDASEEWAYAEIHYETDDGQRGKVRIDTETGNLLAETMIKRTQIDDIDPPLDDSAAKVLPHLVDRMKAFFP